MENQPEYLTMNPVYKWFYKVPLKLQYNYRPYLNFYNEIAWERKLVLNPVKIYTKIKDRTNIKDYLNSMKLKEYKLN